MPPVASCCRQVIWRVAGMMNWFRESVLVPPSTAFTTQRHVYGLTGGRFNFQPRMAGANDLAGLRRVMAGSVDIGAYEWEPPGATLIIIK